MKKAVITTGSKQYMVHEGETLKVELVKTTAKPATKPAAAKTADKGATAPASVTMAVGQKIDFEPLLIIDGDNVQVGTPTVAGAKVSAEILESDVQNDKVTSIRYKAKKRVHTVRGHRQHQTILKITKIS